MPINASAPPPSRSEKALQSIARHGEVVLFSIGLAVGFTLCLVAQAVQ